MPSVKNLSALALPELKKVRKSYDAYVARLAIYEQTLAGVNQRNSATERRNAESRNQRDQWYKMNMAPLEEDMRKIEGDLRDCRVGLIGGFFGGDHIQYNGERYKRFPGEMKSLQHKALQNRIQQIRPSEPRVVYESTERIPLPPKKEVNLQIGGATLKVDLDNLDRHQLDILIGQHEAKEEDSKSRLQSLKARASASEQETRMQAKKFRRDLNKQLDKVPVCPYCSGSLDLNPHLDHIYPVSKGGHSTIKNLVFVCARCNLDKKDMTLRSFLIKRGIDETVVHQHLERLNKDF